MQKSSNDRDIYLLKPLDQFQISFYPKSTYLWNDIIVPQSLFQKLKILNKNVDIIYCKTVNDINIKIKELIEKNISLKVIISNKNLEEFRKNNQNFESKNLISLEDNKKSNLPQQSNNFKNIESLLDFLIIENQNNNNWSQKNSQIMPNLALVTNHQNPTIEKYRYSLFSLQLVKNKEKARKDYLLFIKNYFSPKQNSLIQKFQTQYSISMTNIQILKWYHKNSFYKRSLDYTIKFSNNPLQTAYIRYIFQNLYQAILSEYNLSKNEDVKDNKVIVLKQIDKSQMPLLDFLKDSEGEMVECLGFLTATKNKKKLRETENIAAILQIEVIQSTSPKYEVGYVDVSNLKIYQGKQLQDITNEFIFNAWSVFKVVGISKEVPQIIKLRHGQFSSLWNKKNRSKLQTNQLRSYQNFAIRLNQSIKTQGDALSQYGLHKQSIQFNQKYIQEICGSVENTQMARRLYEIGKSYRILGKIDEAIQNNIRCLEIEKKVLGEFHVSCGTSYSNLGELYNQKNKCQKAIEYYNLGLQIFQKCVGQNHILTAAVHFNLGNTYKKLKKYGNAIDQYLKAVNIQEEILGKGHSSTVKGFLQLAECFSLITQYEKSNDYYTNAVKIQMKGFGKYHLSLANLSRLIAINYKYLGDFKNSVLWFQKQLQIYQKNSIGETQEKAQVFNEIGGIYEAERKFNDSLWYLMNAYKIFNTIYGPKQSKTIKVLAAIKRCEKNR